MDAGLIVGIGSIVLAVGVQIAIVLIGFGRLMAQMGAVNEHLRTLNGRTERMEQRMGGAEVNVARLQEQGKHPHDS